MIATLSCSRGGWNVVYVDKGRFAKEQDETARTRLATRRIMAP
jgi:hypothetical protein